MLRKQYHTQWDIFYWKEVPQFSAKKGKFLKRSSICIMSHHRLSLVWLSTQMLPWITQKSKVGHRNILEKKNRSLTPKERTGWCEFKKEKFWISIIFTITWSVQVSNSCQWALRNTEAVPVQGQHQTPKNVWVKSGQLITQSSLCSRGDGHEVTDEEKGGRREATTVKVEMSCSSEPRQDKATENGYRKEKNV